MRTARRDFRLPRAFYLRDAATVARDLLGHRLVRIDRGRRIAGLIVETEAYLGVEDQASHAFGGRRTERNEAMYALGGAAYVFLNYGIHHLLNVVVARQDDPHAVLLRAIEPTEGLEIMFARRKAARVAQDLCSGPGKLGQAFRISLRENGVDLVTSARLFVERVRDQPLSNADVVATSRIGVDYAGDWANSPLRFYLHGHASVSRP